MSIFKNPTTEEYKTRAIISGSFRVESQSDHWAAPGENDISCYSIVFLAGDGYRVIKSGYSKKQAKTICARVNMAGSWPLIQEIINEKVSS